MAMNNEKPPAEGQGLLRQTLVAGARNCLDLLLVG
jgi:hypothetical protein